MAYELLPRLLRGMATELPGVVVHLHQHTSPVLVEMVRGGRLDLAIVRGPLAETRGLAVVGLTPERLVLAMPEGSAPGSDDEGIDLADAAGHRWALPLASAMPGLAEQALLVCHRAGVTPRDGARADTLVGLLTHVAHGGCVALVPESVRRACPPGVAIRDLLGADPTTVIENLAVRRVGEDDPVLTRISALLPGPRHSG